jgi:hypothetical protein
MHLPSLTPPIAVALLVACSPQVDLKNGSGSNSDGSGSTSSTPSCEELEPEQSAAVQFTVRNTSDAPIFLDQGTCGPAVDVLDAAGNPTAWRFPDCTVPSCEAMLDDDCAVACAGCIQGIIRIAPGGTLDVSWAGTLFADIEAPAACTPAGCDNACARELAAPAGTYNVQTRFHATCPYQDPESCECASGEDTCAIFDLDGTLAETPTMFSVSFEYDQQTTVELALP